MIKEFINSDINNQKSYLIINKAQCVLVDASTNIKTIMAYISTNKLTLIAVIITHGHFDHIVGLKPLLTIYPRLTIFINQWDEFWLYYYPDNNRLPFPSQTFTLVKNKFNVQTLIGSVVMTLIGYQFSFKHIAGHTPGSQYITVDCLNAVFIGDTIFKDKIGFHSIPYCDDEYFRQSLITLTKLKQSYQVYPGHHATFVLQDVLTTNEDLLTFLQKS